MLRLAPGHACQRQHQQQGKYRRQCEQRWRPTGTPPGLGTGALPGTHAGAAAATAAALQLVVLERSRADGCRLEEGFQIMLGHSHAAQQLAPLQPGPNQPQACRSDRSVAAAQLQSERRQAGCGGRGGAAGHSLSVQSEARRVLERATAGRVEAFPGWSHQLERFQCVRLLQSILRTHERAKDVVSAAEAHTWSAARAALAPSAIAREALG